MLQKLVVPIDWKATDDDQVLVGYASTFGNVDLGGDVVTAGAFAKTIANIKANGIPLLADHVPSVNSVLGTIYDAEEDGTGLKIWARFSSAQSAQEARTKMIEGHVNKMSIGYEIPEGGAKFGDQGGLRVRFLNELKLWEVSVVVFPMNPAAIISTVKSIVDAAGEGIDYEQMVAEARQAVHKSFPADADPEEVAAAAGGAVLGALEAKATANELREAIDKALSRHHEGTKEFAYVRDFDDSKVWYELYGSGDKGIFERTYEVDDTAAVTLGESAVEVRAVVSYVPVDASSGDKATTLHLGTQEDGEVADLPDDAVCIEDGCKAAATHARTVELVCGEHKVSVGDEPASASDELAQKAADPVAPASDEPAATPDEGVKGWDQWGSEALLNGRDPDAIAEPAKRAWLAQKLDLIEADVNRSRSLLGTSALQALEPTEKE